MIKVLNERGRKSTRINEIKRIKEKEKAIEKNCEPRGLELVVPMPHLQKC